MVDTHYRAHDTWVKSRQPKLLGYHAVDDGANGIASYFRCAREAPQPIMRQPVPPVHADRKLLTIPLHRRATTSKVTIARSRVAIPGLLRRSRHVPESRPRRLSSPYAWKRVIILHLLELYSRRELLTSLYFTWSLSRVTSPGSRRCRRRLR